MKRRERLLPLILVLAAAAGAGCDDDPTDPGDDPGAVAFDYEGAESGSFEVQGDEPTISVEGVPEFGEWTLAAEGDSLGGVVIAGFRTNDDDTGDLFILQLDDIRTGEFTCEPSGECHGRVLFGIPDGAGVSVGDAERWFEIVSGDVDVSEADGEIVGTFSFEAADEGGAGSDTLTVTDGSFGVPLATGQASGVSVVCFGSGAAGEECPLGDDS